MVAQLRVDAAADDHDRHGTMVPAMKRTPTIFGALVISTAVSVSSTASATTEPDPGGASEFAELVAMLPADAVTNDAALIVYTDMTLLWERIGVGTDAQARLDAMVDLAAPGTFSTTPQLFGSRQAQVEEARAEVGFSFLEIDRELAVSAPPDNIFIDVTTVAPEAIDAAVASNPVWSERVNHVVGEHGRYIDWGDGREVDPTAISPLRPLGQAGQLAVIGDPATTVRTLDAADVEAVLATTAGEGESATTTHVLGSIVDVLGDELVMQAFVQPSPTMFAPPVNASPEVIEQLFEDIELAPPYLGIAIVEIADGDGTRTEALLVYPNETTAVESAEFVETALTEGVDLTTMEPLADVFPHVTVAVDGAVVRVDVSGEGAFRRLYHLLMSRSLFPS